MILGLQIIAIVFSLSMIYFAVLYYKRGELNSIEIASWLIFWILTMVVVIFPEFLRALATKFFITRLFDLIVVAGFLLVISMTAKTYIRTRKIEKKLEDYVRQEAVDSLKKTKKRAVGRKK